MSKEVPSLEAEYLLQNYVEADLDELDAAAEAKAMKALKDSRMLGSHVTPFGVSLAEKIDPVRIKPGMDKGSDTATTTIVEDSKGNRTYVHDHD